MNFLKKWFTPKDTEQSLSIPDFKNAPMLAINMSGTMLTFKNPKMSATIPFTPPITGIDIHNIQTYSEPVHNFEKSYYLKFYGSGWNYRLGNNSFGGTTLSGVASKTYKKYENQNLFNQESLVEWIIEDEKASFGATNDAILKDKIVELGSTETERIKEQYFFRYPTCSNDIQKMLVNGINWLQYSIFQPGFEPTIILSTSISPTNMIIFTFDPSSYQDDYYSPSHNTPELVEKTISDFIGSFHIKLSEEAKDQLRNTPQPTVINIED